VWEVEQLCSSREIAEWMAFFRIEHEARLKDEAAARAQAGVEARVRRRR
jgi:hypothetical protein